MIFAAFQVMNDAGGIKVLVGAVSERFKSRRALLLVLISFLFYCFGSFLGLFEEKDEDTAVWIHRDGKAVIVYFRFER